MLLRHTFAAGAGIAILAGAALAQGKAPAPEFAVEMAFKERMAQFCKAGGSEAEWRTPIGQILEVTEE